VELGEDFDLGELHETTSKLPNEARPLVKTEQQQTGRKDCCPSQERGRRTRVTATNLQGGYRISPLAEPGGGQGDPARRENR